MGRAKKRTATAPDGHTRMGQIAEGLPSTAAKIRALYRAGYDRGAIYRFLGVKYQQVYNVLKRSGMDEPQRAYTAASKWVWAKVGPAGRLTLPPAHLEALGLREGSPVQFVLEDRAIRVVPRDVALKEIQEDVARYVPRGVSLVDELIAERRREVAAEEKGD